MLKKVIWGILLVAISLQPSHTLSFLSSDSVRLMANGTGRATPWHTTLPSQLSTSEADYRARLASVARMSAEAAPATETWPLLLTCLGMAVFVLSSILRRIRQVDAWHKRGA